MENAPRLSPYDAPEVYDLLYGDLDFDIPYWTEVAGSAGGPVLEMACGSGRVLLALRRAGLDVEGLDASPAMIGRLRDKAAAAGLAVRAEVADMRSFDLGRRYARIFCAFNGFAHCETIADQIACLRAALAHLEPGGALVLHMSYPGPAYWLEPEGRPVFEHETVLPDGGKVQMWDNRRKDIVGQRQDSELEIWELDAAERPKAVHKFAMSQRWVYPFELELLLAAAGFARSEIFGGFDRRPLRQPDDQMIAWAYRAEAGA
ncbi:MAG TPA: class I SAM-dependent methyltransferase [Candidatus Aminicenantes bacterium]|nr:class I SAM-dependent methyltransferase [Candidatus Aminicenantes bacterium]HRY64944.1 class I SAM-dependent methyltransferase [Candidatus Aminicenantes bacterium]HRZ71857.1 class I SAM-dependent methyltransferase [Candidatus Aminicenantes bacterium]